MAWERVELELWLHEDRVAAALHVLDCAGTPTRSFGGSGLARPWEADWEAESKHADEPGDAGDPAASGAAADGADGGCGDACSQRQPSPCPAPSGAPGGSVPEQQLYAAGDERLADGAAPSAAAACSLSSAAPAPSAGSRLAAQASSTVPACSDPATPSASAAAGGPGAAAPAAGVRSAAAALEPAAAAQAALQEVQAGREDGPTLASLMGMLQRLLSHMEHATPSAQQSAHMQLPPVPSADTSRNEQLPILPAQQPPAAPASAASTSAAAARPADGSSRRGRAAAEVSVPGGAENLLALELEVVQLQQSLQIAQLEHETRTVQLLALKQRAGDAEQRQREAEERSSSLASQVRQLERLAGELKAQLAEAAARHQQESSQQAAQLSAAAAKLEEAEREAARLRQELADARREAEEVREQARRLGEGQQAALLRASEEQQARLRQAAAEQQAALRRSAARQENEWQAQVAGLQHENAKLRAHVAAACAELRGMGIEPNKVFSRAALAAAGMPTPAASPQRHSPSMAAAEASASQRRQPPNVPRLQLSSISLQQLQARASPHPQQAPRGATSDAQHAQQQQQAGAGDGGAFAHVLAADGAPALAGPGVQAAAAAGAALSPSPASSVQQNGDVGLPPLLTSRRAVSPAAQELLNSARQWKESARAAADEQAEAEEVTIPAYYPPPLPSARASCRGPVQPAWGAADGAAAGPPLTARRHTPRPQGFSPLKRPAACKPGGTPRRQTFGQLHAFQEVKAAYAAVMSSEADRSAKWAKNVFSNASAIDTDPGRVDTMVQGLLQLFASNGVPIPLVKCAPCQYRLGSAKLALRLCNGRLVARSGAGQQQDVFAWLERQPVGQAGQAGHA